jgi:hypothetical protein
MSLPLIGFPPAPDERPKEDAFGAILRGLMEGEDRKLKREEKKGIIDERELGNALLKEFGAREKEAKIKKDERDAKFGSLTGGLGQAMGLHLLEQELGPNHPVVKNAKERYNLEKESQEKLNDYRQQLIDTEYKRNASSQSKLDSELEDIKNGIRPGSRQDPIPLRPGEQKQLISEWKAAKMKQITDPAIRERNLFASNIDKTLSTFKPEDLVQYAGIAGGLKKKKEQGKALVGKESEEYRKYEQALTSVEVLSNQVRQFYKGSVQPSEMAHLKELSNPSTWLNNPKSALEKFNRVKEILEKETDTFRDAAIGIEAYQKPSKEEGLSRILSNPAQALSDEELEKIISGAK